VTGDPEASTIPDNTSDTTGKTAETTDTAADTSAENAPNSTADATAGTAADTTLDTTADTTAGTVANTTADHKTSNGVGYGFDRGEGSGTEKRRWLGSQLELPEYGAGPRPAPDSKPVTRRGPWLSPLLKLELDRTSHRHGLAQEGA